eukprot:361330-Chlamydomonas_euryale.AAC.2
MERQAQKTCMHVCAHHSLLLSQVASHGLVRARAFPGSFIDLATSPGKAFPGSFIDLAISPGSGVSRVFHRCGDKSGHGRFQGLSSMWR